MVPLKYLSNFCRALEMPLINFETNLDLNWSNVTNQVITFSINDSKLYVPVVNLLTQDNA